VVALVVNGHAQADGSRFLLLADEALLGFIFLMLASALYQRVAGVAMILQAIQFSLHAYYLVGRASARPDLRDRQQHRHAGRPALHPGRHGAGLARGLVSQNNCRQAAICAARDKSLLAFRI
jgi:hypothetical protein